MANEPKVSAARKAARDILLNELGALLPLTEEHYARLDRMERIIDSVKTGNRAEVFRTIEKELKRWAQFCKANGVLPIETILGEDNSLQHALTDAALEAACSQPVAPGDRNEVWEWLRKNELCGTVEDENRCADLIARYIRENENGRTL